MERNAEEEENQNGEKEKEGKEKVVEKH